MLQLSINIAFKLSLNQIMKQEVLEYQLSETCSSGGGVVCWVSWFYAAAVYSYIPFMVVKLEWWISMRYVYVKMKMFYSLVCETRPFLGQLQTSRKISS